MLISSSLSSSLQPLFSVERVTRWYLSLRWILNFIPTICKVRTQVYEACRIWQNIFHLLLLLLLLLLSTVVVVVVVVVGGGGGGGGAAAAAYLFHKP
jgi:hypothetical protein